MTTCERQRGFTLIEIVVVLAVMGLLVGAAAPLAGAVIDADRRQEARLELADLSTALESYYYQHAAFPASLTATDFLGVHLQPGVMGTAVTDPFGAGGNYGYSVAAGSASAAVWSRGENMIDDGVAGEEFVATVHSAVPGTARTRQRLRIVVEALANHLEAGGSVAGGWSAVRAAMGLGVEYDRDGFGTTLQWTAATLTLTSAGPDRSFGTADDIVI